MEDRIISLKVSSVDGFYKAAKFKTLDGARRFAHRYVGPHPEVGTNYAVEGYSGTTKIVWSVNVTPEELFPSPE